MVEKKVLTSLKMEQAAKKPVGPQTLDTTPKLQIPIHLAESRSQVPRIIFMNLYISHAHQL